MPNHDTVARKSMRSLGIYKAEFEPIIKIYAQLRDQYDELTGQFEASGFNFQIATKAGSKKAPIVTTLESLRKDILSYASQLGLTPQGLLKADTAAFTKKSGCLLSSVLGELSE